MCVTSVRETDFGFPDLSSTWMTDPCRIRGCCFQPQRVVHVNRQEPWLPMIASAGCFACAPHLHDHLCCLHADEQPSQCFPNLTQVHVVPVLQQIINVSCTTKGTAFIVELHEQFADEITDNWLFGPIHGMQRPQGRSRWHAKARGDIEINSILKIGCQAHRLALSTLRRTSCVSDTARSEDGPGLRRY
jgi:hypothetical protein